MTTLLDEILSEGFPERQENWKYIDFSALKKKPFILAPKSDIILNQNISQHDVWKTFILPHIFYDNYLVFLNGYLVQSVLSESIILQTITNSNINSNLSALLLTNDIFSRLNQHFCQENYQLLISNAADNNIQKLQILYAASESGWIQPRLKICVKNSVQIQLIENFLGINNITDTVTNAVTEIILPENALLEYTKIQRENAGAIHIGRTYIDIGRNSYAHTVTLSEGAHIGRSDIHVKLKAENARCSLDGLYISKNKNMLDHHTIIEHISPHTDSIQSYRGILMDKSRAVFNGKVLVHANAHQSSAVQENHNLLLSDQAEIDTKPELEIYHDDIKCSHGATIGQLDENALFYLRSRGIENETARKMLIQAFAENILNKIPDKLLQEKLCLSLI